MATETGMDTGAHMNDVIAGLEVAYGRPTACRLLAMLSADLCRFQDNDPGDRNAIEEHAHAVKGAAANLGFSAVEAACGALEQACQAGAPIEALLGETALACADARQAIDRHLSAA